MTGRGLFGRRSNDVKSYEFGGAGRRLGHGLDDEHSGVFGRRRRQVTLSCLIERFSVWCGSD